MRTVILCGGRGTRAYPYTANLPKPMLEIAGQPILRHVMEIYARQGHTGFVLATGFRGELIDEYATTLPDEWEVQVVDTGEDTGTAERIRRCVEHAGERFFATYGDGVGNVDLETLAAVHAEHRGGVVTVVALPSQYGTVEFDERGAVL